MQANPSTVTSKQPDVVDLIRAIEATDLVWRISSPGAMGTGTRAEAMIRSAGGPWIFGYGATVNDALADVLAKWEAQS